MEEAAFRLLNAAIAEGKAVVMMGPLGCEHTFGKEAVVMSVVKEASCYNCHNDVRFCLLSWFRQRSPVFGMLAMQNGCHQEWCNQEYV
jgi:hypothetical protein